MKIFFQILTSFALAYWPILVMTSVMIFDAPGSTDNKQAILMALTVVFLPMILGLLYYIFNQTFWGISPKVFLIITIVVPILASLLFGYPKLLLNNMKGVSSNGYFVKEDKVYYEGNLIEAKPTNFEVVDEFRIYARDSVSVYFRGRRIEGADPKNFRLAFEASQYYRDDQSIYYEGKVLPGSDAATFERLKRADQPSIYYKDKNSVYWFGRKLEGIKADSVKVLSEEYLVDNESVFYYEKKIVGADPVTFAVYPDEGSFAKDKKAFYFQDVAYPEVDSATIEFLERGYAKDKSKVYYRDGRVLTVVAGANAASFKVTNWDQKTESEATDGTKYFVEGKAK